MTKFNKSIIQITLKIMLQHYFIRVLFFILIFISFNYTSEMDDDDFNDFQQAVEAPQETQPENSYKEDQLNEHQKSLAQNMFTPIVPLPINASSYLAAEPIQPPNGNIEIKDVEGSSQPHLNKIQSENLSTPKDVFFNLDKNYQRSEPTNELIDYSNVNYVQDQNLFNEILSVKVEDSDFQNLENKNLDQNIKIQKEYQSNETFSKEQFNLDSRQINIPQNKYHQSKVEDQAQESQSLPVNYQQQNQKEQMYLNKEKNKAENKQIQSYKEQQYMNFQQKSQHKQETKYQSQEEDQFGDFQQTLPNTEETDDVQIKNVQDQDYQSEIPQPQPALSIMKKRTRKQQLQQFVNKLPDYSFLFLQTFQSF